MGFVLRGEFRFGPGGGRRVARGAGEVVEHERHRHEETGQHDGRLCVANATTGQDRAKAGKRCLIDRDADPRRKIST